MSIKNIDLRFWADEAPEVIHDLAVAFNYKDIGFVLPYLYRSTEPQHHFDQIKAERNYDEIASVLVGQDYVITDLEKLPRRIVRDPDDYETKEVKWAQDQYISMWAWFRNKFPNLKLSEWGFHKAQYAGDQDMAEKLMLRYTDTIDCSVYWKPYSNWHNSRSNYISRAVSLGQQHSKPVILWVYDRYQVWTENHSVRVSHPITEQAMNEMITMAVREGVEIIVVWSNVFKILANNKPYHVIAETIGQAPSYDVLPVVTAQMALLLSRLQLRVG